MRRASHNADRFGIEPDIVHMDRAARKPHHDIPGQVPEIPRERIPASARDRHGGLTAPACFRLGCLCKIAEHGRKESGTCVRIKYQTSSG